MLVKTLQVLKKLLACCCDCSSTARAGSNLQATHTCDAPEHVALQLLSCMRMEALSCRACSGMVPYRALLTIKPAGWSVLQLNAGCSSCRLCWSGSSELL